MSNKKRGTAGASTDVVEGAGGAEESNNQGAAGPEGSGGDVPENSGGDQGGDRPADSGDQSEAAAESVTGEGGAVADGAALSNESAVGADVVGEAEGGAAILADARIGPLVGWAEGLSYPFDAILRNDGHFSVAEPETASMLCAGTTVTVTLHDVAHAVRVLQNLMHLNGSTFHGEHKLRVDGYPGELIEAKG